MSRDPFRSNAASAPLTAADLPSGSAPLPLALPHFPDRLHAFVWRNWQLVPPERMAQVVGATPAQIVAVGNSMGLAGPPRVTPEQERRSHLTVIRRNWHLLPYGQLLTLLGWSADQLAFALREDDFLFIKLGSLKPRCDSLGYAPPDAAARDQAAAIARTVRREFGAAVGELEEPLFHFVADLSRLTTDHGPPTTDPSDWAAASAAPSTELPTPDAQGRAPAFCYSYFALYGDPLLEPELDPYPDGYLQRLAGAGVNGVWLQAVLSRLSPFPWDPALSDRYEERRRNLRALVDRAKRHGIGIFLYLNEPRALPLSFFDTRPELKGAAEGDYAALCTSAPEVQRYLVDVVRSLCQAVPDLAAFFTITASENLSNCWSHGGGAGCPRCGKRSPAEVIAEVNALFAGGIRSAGTGTGLFIWDWGWAEAWAGDVIKRLPEAVSLMSVSEWDLPIRRGGVETTVGEYSLSAIGPGPRARRHWTLARQRGLKTIAKMQAGNSWELSAVPYVPAVENAARHAVNLRAEELDGLMLGWTLGGYPSPNLEVVAEVMRSASVKAAQAMLAVAERRFGPQAAPHVVEAWRAFSSAFAAFPYHISVVYNAPLQLGPANPLWGEPTGYHATMIGFPYDDLDTWRSVYPADVFAGQLEKVAEGFDSALVGLSAAPAPRSGAHARNLEGEQRVAEAAAIHFRSVSNQARFVEGRRQLAATQAAPDREALCRTLEALLEREIDLARWLYALQQRDPRLGFEASNQYYYVPLDLVEKVLNCRDLLERWLPQQVGVG